VDLKEMHKLLEYYRNLKRKPLAMTTLFLWQMMATITDAV